MPSTSWAYFSKNTNNCVWRPKINGRGKRTSTTTGNTWPSQIRTTSTLWTEYTTPKTAELTSRWVVTWRRYGSSLGGRVSPSSGCPQRIILVWVLRIRRLCWSPWLMIARKIRIKQGRGKTPFKLYRKLLQRLHATASWLSPKVSTLGNSN